MNFLAKLIVILVLQNCARGVDPRRPCREVSNAREAETYELHPKDGYFTLVSHGSTSAAELEYESCDGKTFVNSAQSGLPNAAGSMETRQRLHWPETGGGDKQPNVGSGASNDVVVAVEEKPMDEEKERLVVVGRNPDHAGKKEVPAYVIVTGPKLDQDSKSRDRMVTISLDTLNSLIQGSLFPPSGPSMDHNWYVTSLADHESYQDTDADQMLVLRVVRPAGQNVNVADTMPGFQEDGTYQSKD